MFLGKLWMLIAIDLGEVDWWVILGQILCSSLVLCFHVLAVTIVLVADVNQQVFMHLNGLLNIIISQD